MQSNVVERKIMWGDLDALAIVFYPRYYEWFDGCGNLFMESIGLNVLRVRDEHRVIFGLVKTSAEYFQPGRYHQEIRITTSIADLTKKTVSLQHLVHNKADGALMVKGQETRICMDLRDPGKISACTMPDEVYRAFSQAL
jgi:YbgC/YbaW family acyl-CoA thioester hydrolase